MYLVSQNKKKVSQFINRVLFLLWFMIEILLLLLQIFMNHNKNNKRFITGVTFKKFELKELQ